MVRDFLRLDGGAFERREEALESRAVIARPEL